MMRIRRTESTSIGMKIDVSCCSSPIAWPLFSFSRLEIWFCRCWIAWVNRDCAEGARDEEEISSMGTHKLC
jgi:hypothetical protein